jgi:hypothetical protein
MLEQLITYIRTFANVEFMRAIDVAEMWSSRHYFSRPNELST